MDMLETGVVLCQLAEELQQRMILANNGKVFLPNHLPSPSHAAQSTTDVLLISPQQLSNVINV